MATRQLRKQGKAATGANAERSLPLWRLTAAQADALKIPQDARRIEIDALEDSQYTVVVDGRVWRDSWKEGAAALSALRADSTVEEVQTALRERAEPARMEQIQLLLRDIDSLRRETTETLATWELDRAEIGALLYAVTGNAVRLSEGAQALERARLRARSPRIASERRILEGKAQYRQSAAQRRADIVRRVKAKRESGAPSLNAAYRLVARELSVSEATVRHAWERRPK